MAISFEAIGERMVTFAAGTGLKEGKVCKMTANGTVGACGENDSFIGVVSSVRGGAANVVMGGYVEVSYRFTFCEAPGAAEEPTAGIGQTDGKRFYELREGQTLWTVSNAYGLSMTELLRLNPQIAKPNEVQSGTRVRVR